MVRLVARRAPLRDDAAFRAWLKDRPNDPRGQDSASLEVGTVELVPGDATPITIRLPSEWNELPK